MMILTFSLHPITEGQENQDLETSFVTYYGEAGQDQFETVAMTADLILQAGWTTSENITMVLGNSTYGGNTDGFYVLMNHNNTILYSSYLGGNDLDYIYDAIADSEGNFILTGYTMSDDFPANKSGVWNNTRNGAEDAFLVKLNATGELVAATYFGGSGRDYGLSLDLDSHGNIILVGSTDSNDFPIQGNFYNDSYSLNDDLFVANISQDLSTLYYSSYFGGDSGESPADIEVANGLVYITGRTRSTYFPVTADALQLESGNTGTGFIHDAFISILNLHNGSLVYSSYIGGSYNDFGTSLYVDRGGNPIIMGDTDSDDFPTVEGADQVLNGFSDLFFYYVQVFTPNSSSLSLATGKGWYSSYIGTNAAESNAIILVPIGPRRHLCPTIVVYDTFTGSGSELGAAILNVIRSADADDFENEAEVEAVQDLFLSYATNADDIFGTVIWGRARENIDLEDSTQGWCGFRIVGYTSEETLPTTPNAPKEEYGGGVSDAYIAEFRTYYNTTENVSETSTSSSLENTTSTTHQSDNLTPTSSVTKSTSDGTGVTDNTSSTIGNTKDEQFTSVAPTFSSITNRFPMHIPWLAVIPIVFYVNFSRKPHYISSISN